MMIDIDHFKVINDSWGHATGDVALCRLCEVAEKTLRENDIFGRVGGEEFAVLLPETTSAGAVAAGERLRRAVEQLELTSAEGDPIKLTASFGVTAYRASDQSFEELVSRADDALYEAKRRGRNRVCFSARPSPSAGATSPPSSIEPLADQSEELLELERMLVELMGGSLTGESRPGFGSVFTCKMTLPLAEDEAVAGTSPASELWGRRALIIDDNPVSADVLAEKLRAWTLTVTVAHTVDEALEVLLAEEPLDVVLIDDTILLTEADAVLAQLDRDQGDETCRLIALSSHEAGEALLGLGSRRALELVVKPPRDQSLLEALTLSGGGPELRASSEEELSGLRWRAWAMVVEDDPTNQHTARLLLNRFGLEVVLARDGKDALERLAEQPFSLVFMDCHLPVLDGREATRRIRRSGHSWANVPVVAMTGYNNPREHDACFSAGMNDYLVKPLTKRSLAEVLSRHLGPAERIEGRAISRALLIDGEDDTLRQARGLIRELWPGAAVRFVPDAFDCCLSIGNIQPDLVMARLETLGEDSLRLVEVLDSSQRLRSLRFLFVTALPFEDPLCRSVIEAGAELCDDEELANELRHRLSQPPEDRPRLTTTQPGPTNEAPVIDPRVVEELLGDDLTSIRRLFSLFFEDVYHQLSLLNDPDCTRDESFRRAVHRLQGAAGDVGAEWLRSTAHELESAMSCSDQRRCQELVEDLCEHVEQLRLAALDRGWFSSDLSR